MSLTSRESLKEITKVFCRELRRNQTSAEKLLWNYLKNRRFHNIKFYRQYPIFHDISGTETFFIADFYSHSLKLIIELDGPLHQYCIKYDNERSDILNLKGYKILRFQNEDVIKNITTILNRIEKILPE